MVLIFFFFLVPQVTEVTLVTWVTHSKKVTVSDISYSDLSLVTCERSKGEFYFVIILPKGGGRVLISTETAD
jgi:hypothetical protein